MNLHIRRKSTFWVINVVLPLYLVTSTLFATFGLSPDETSDRLSASLTILLAIVSFQTFTAEKLPKTTTVSLMDMYKARMPFSTL